MLVSLKRACKLLSAWTFDADSPSAISFRALLTRILRRSSKSMGVLDAMIAVTNEGIPADLLVVAGWVSIAIRDP